MALGDAVVLSAKAASQPPQGTGFSAFRRQLHLRKEELQREIKAIDQLLEELPRHLPPEADGFLYTMYWDAKRSSL